MKPKNRRLFIILGTLLSMGVGVFLILEAFRKNIIFFHTPKDLKTENIPPSQHLRLGGLVKEGSIIPQGNTTVFVVTDGQSDVPVIFTGLLPDLFREGQGVVAEGTYDAGLFTATSVLAKHDENYMPRDVKNALQEGGYWKPQKETP